MIGNLYFPESMDHQQRYPAVVCVNPAGGVKEQTAGLYAAKLAQLGFVTLAYDAAYQGESGGTPRYLEDPYQRVDDISAAIDFLEQQPFVAEDQIGVLGICAGGGYAVNASMQDRRIQAVATISAVNIGALFRHGWTGQQTVAEAMPLQQLARMARRSELAGEAITYVPFAPLTVEEAPHPDLAEAAVYYRTDRAHRENAPSQMTTQSLAKLATYDAFHLAEVFLTQPSLFIAGSTAGSLWYSEDIWQRAASINKTLKTISGAGHVDLYDQPGPVNETMVALAQFFTKYLN